MRRVAFAVASFALFAGTSAVAQEITNIQATAGSSYQTPGLECGIASCTTSNPLPAGAGRFPGDGVGTGGAAYNSFVDIGADAIFFESSNSSSQGPFLSFSSSSEVSFDVYTDGPGFDFHSEITPQGLGMYLADTSGGCIFTNSCAQVSDEDFQFSQLVTNTGDANGFLGGVAFSFEILDNESVIYSLTGSLFLARNVGGCDGLCFIDGLGSFGDPPSVPPTGARSLTGFSQQTDPLDYSARAFGWQATEVILPLSSGFHAIEYRTSVATFTSANCLDGGNVCLVAYSGFGDPIGRGGAIDALSSFDVGSLEHMGDDDLIQGLNFTPARFGLPRFVNGELTFDSSGAVPEPGTWALMIMGFGAMGAALRRRRIPAHI